MSPGEGVREKALQILADPATGLNPAFVAGCQKRNIEVPLTGSAPKADQPFIFGPGSPNVFRMEDDINWLERNTEQQYPCLVAYVKSVKQYREGRTLGSIFFGEVTVAFCGYFAWYTEQPPQDNNFESVLDAFEESLLVVLNKDVSIWYPVVYSNLLDFPRRLPMVSSNEGQLLRRGIEAQLTALVSI